MSNTYRVRAAFQVPGVKGWTWITWTDHTSAGNKHAAILAKAKEVKATAWDFGQADYEETNRANF